MRSKNLVIHIDFEIRRENMKKYLLKVLSLMLCIAILEPMVSVTYAATKESDNITELSNGTRFYFETTETYNLAMTQGEEYVDYAIKYFDQDAVYYGILDLQDVSVTYTESEDEVFQAIKKSLNSTATNIPLEEINIGEILLNESVYDQQRSIPTEDKEKINEAIYDLGHPAAYEDRLIATHSNSSGTMVGRIMETLYYTYYEEDSFFIAAATAISVVSALVGLAPATLFSILSFSATAYGVYQTVVDSQINKYRAGVLYTKSVYINNTYVMPAGWQVVWNAYVGMNGAALTERTNNLSDEYALSNIELIELAYTRY